MSKFLDCFVMGKNSFIFSSRRQKVEWSWSSKILSFAFNGSLYAFKFFTGVDSTSVLGKLILAQKHVFRCYDLSDWGIYFEFLS